MSESIYKALTHLGPCQISMNKIGKNFSLEGIHDLATAELVLQLSYSSFFWPYQMNYPEVQEFTIVNNVIYTNFESTNLPTPIYKAKLKTTIINWYRH